MTRIALHLLLCAMAFVESECNPIAFNEAEDAAGILQIRPIMVHECNRIVGRQAWSMDDRYDVVQSFLMAECYFNHHCKGFTAEQTARCWNGGPDGWRQECTELYWLKVKKRLAEFSR